MGMKRFPSELEDAVIDFCYADHATVASCGLVCRDWLPASRFHLFSSVSLTAQNTAGLGDILSGSPGLASLVREVELRFSDATLLDLVRTLMLLPRTAKLSLRPTRDEVTRELGTSSLFRPLTALPLVHLKFDFRSRFDSLQQAIDCVCLCPHLESLEMGGSWMKRGDFAVPPRLPKGLRTLTLTCDLEYFLNWMVVLEDDMPEIETLSLLHIVRREVPAIVNYVQRSGPTLRSLNLVFRDNDAPTRLAAQIDLTRNPNISSFALEGVSPGIIACLAALLPQLHACQVQEIIFTIRHGKYAEADRVMKAYPWDTLDRLLGDPQLCFLKTLRLTVVEPLSRTPQDDVAEYIMGQLPLTRERGIVAF